MFSYLTTLWWRGDPDEKDAISGMSRRDVYNVQKSWAAINANAHDSGFLIFTRMFEKDPETQAFFKFLSGASKADMAASVNFRAHIVNLMTSLNGFVEHLPQPAVAVALLQNLGAKHGHRKIRRKHFYVLRDVLTEILKNDLRLSQDVLTSWEHFIDFMLKSIFETLKE